MTRSRRPRRSLPALLLAVALVLVGCSQSSDPDTWEDAEKDLAPGEISTIEANFMRSCEEANGGAQADGVTDYCQCSYDALRRFYDSDGRTLEDFTDDEAELREDPEAINNPSLVPAGAVDLLDGCAAEHLAS